MLASVTSSSCGMCMTRVYCSISDSSVVVSIVGKVQDLCSSVVWSDCCLDCSAVSLRIVVVVVGILSAVVNVCSLPRCCSS